jgi:serine O-acetyltransferase
MDAEHDRKLRDIVASILESYERHGELGHLEGGSLPSREIIWGIVEDLLRLLFPGFLDASELSAEHLAARTAARIASVEQRLRAEIEKGLRFRNGSAEACSRNAETATFALLAAIPAIRDVLVTDIEAAYDGDPAAQGLEEIILAYPGSRPSRCTAWRTCRTWTTCRSSPGHDGVRALRTRIDIHPGRRSAGASSSTTAPGS